MRLGMLDVGSNTVHLLVVDAHAGGHPMPAASRRTPLGLVEMFEGEALTSGGADRLVEIVAEARHAATELGVEDFAAFGTSALREAVNADEVCERIRTETGVDLHVLDGDDEARLTFLAARRWFGWSAGRLLLVDIGGGSLELAAGIDETPDAVASLALGAGRLTRERLPDDPPQPEQLHELAAHVRAAIARELRPFTTAPTAERAVGTSKTLRALARIAGAAPYRDGPYVRRVLGHDDAARVLEK